MTFTNLGALIDLLRARADDGTGFVPVERMIIRRLRKALDAAELGAGKALIETGCGQEYRLTIPRAMLAERVAIEATFFELESLKVISAEQSAALRGLFRVIDPT